MKNVVVTEGAVRELVREALWNTQFAGWSSNDGGPATVNSAVDPSIAMTDPVNPDFTPQDKIEFGVAVAQLVRNIPDEQMPELYGVMKATIKDKAQKEEEEAQMKINATQGGTKQVEGAVRQAVRNIIADLKPNRQISEAPETQARPERKPLPRRLKKGEVPGPVMNLDNLPPVKKIPAGVHGGEYNRRIEKNKADLHKNMPKAIADYENPAPDPDDEIESPESTATPDASGKRKAYKSTALGGMSDVEGQTFDQIATDLGFSVAGAKQAVDKALDKARFLAQDVDEDDLEIMILTAMNDYVKYLSKSGELEASDVQLMKDHPEIVRGLDGFREFMHNHIRRARKADQSLVNPLSDENPDLVDLEPEEEPERAPTAPTPAAAPRATNAPGAPAKGSYKIYPGGKRYGGKPVVTRYKGKVYGPGGETEFKPNEQGEISVDGNNLKVKRPGSDHTQMWEPVEENKRPVLYLRPRSR